MSMRIPQANYVVDSQGQKIFVQLTVQDWEKFVEEFRQMQNLASMKKKLKSAFLEIRQIQQGKKAGTPLTEFLNEL